MMNEPPVLFIDYHVIRKHRILVSSQTALATPTSSMYTRVHPRVPMELQLSLCGLCEAFRSQETTVRMAAAGCSMHQNNFNSNRTVSEI